MLGLLYAYTCVCTYMYICTYTLYIYTYTHTIESLDFHPEFSWTSHSSSPEPQPLASQMMSIMLAL